MERSRAASVTLAVLLAALATGVGWLAASDLVDLVRGAHARAPSLTVATGSAAALPAVLAIALVAGLLVIPMNDRWQRLLFGGILACLPFVLIGPLALYLMAGWMLPARGYTQCDRPVAGARFLTTGWVRGDAG